MSNLTSKMRAHAKASRRPSNSTRATVNRAGGTAFEINDAALKLVCMTGGSFYAEPKFYSGSAVVPKRLPGGELGKLARRLEIADSKLEGFISGEELDDVAREVVATAIDVANSDRPEDLLAIARWLRNEANIRLTPQVLLVIASRLDATKPFVRSYAPHIVVRPDEVKICLLLHRFFFGMKSLSNCLDFGLGEALSRFGERALMKYDGTDYPTWKDVLCTIHRGKKGKSSGKGSEWPLPRALTNYLITGKVTDPKKIPIVAARKELAKLTKLDDRAKALAVESKVNWEVLLSQFGRTPETKTEVWEHLLDNNLVGYMALLRNLRNLLKAGVSDSVIDRVAGKLSDSDEVLRSRQLPFRFLQAHRVLKEDCGGYGSSCSSLHLNQILGAVESASNAAAANVPVMPGLTAVFADNSGSMEMNKVSKESKVTCAAAANALCGIIAKSAEKAVVCAFGTDIAPVNFTDNDTVIGIADKVEGANTRGQNTNAHLIPQWLRRQGLKPDRVIVLSDLQTWSDSSMSGVNGYRARNASEEKALCDTWADYVSFSGGKSTWLHCVHLNGYGDSPVDEGMLLNQVSGFSEKVVKMLLQAEGSLSVEKEEDSLPTVDQIRKEWYL
jgi:hypothetical protein